ncbi:hypothetical protein NERG_01370 [Nematocida ausubeli]|uniref:Uncharacterized protein n=1 Tax=Nematocida ausubeli (strain ATCC PRA-371 / ERTm2) TaxID=1913371 RepID=H8ZCC7_NEMA1|nr:hypothetical protein NERG_01370 [Nematocida ausubeli]
MRLLNILHVLIRCSQNLVKNILSLTNLFQNKMIKGSHSTYTVENNKISHEESKNTSVQKENTSKAILHSSRDIVHLKFNKEGMQSDIKEIEECIKNSSDFEIHTGMNILQGLVSQNTEITVSKKLQPKTAELLSKISRLVLEETIISEWLGEDRLLYNTASIYRLEDDNLNELLITDLTSMIKAIEDIKLMKVVENRIEKWYKSLKEISELDMQRYLEHISKIMNERSCLNLILNIALRRNLKAFLSKVQAEGIEYTGIDLFKKREDGVYALDYGMDLILRNKQVHPFYADGKAADGVANLTDEDKAIICQVYVNMPKIVEINETIRKITEEDDDEYFDRSYLAGEIEEKEKKRPITHLSKIEYNESKIDYYQKVFLAQPNTSESQKAYITERVSEFKRIAKVFAFPSVKNTIKNTFLKAFGILGLGTLAATTVYLTTPDMGPSYN